jgi:hypothetical protein
METFSRQDLKRIEAEGLTPNAVVGQLKLIRKGTAFMKINRPCTLNDGISAISEKEQNLCIRAYEDAADKGRISKFVPASGAASRMFQDWIRISLKRDEGIEKETHKLFPDLKKFAFFDDLCAILLALGLSFETFKNEQRYADLLDYILTSKGLNYSFLPKALLKFHRYSDRSRTPLEEHLVEAALYTRDARNICRLHMTVSVEHEQLTKQYLDRVQSVYETQFGVRFDIQISAQKSSTNTIFVDMNNRPFRDEKGRLMFRPGGHGALLDNLNAVDGDIVMVKNIDNVVPDRLKNKTVLYKKILGGYLIRIQGESFKYLDKLNHSTQKEIITQAERFCNRKFDTIFHENYFLSSDREKKDILIRQLSRPIRVCGMVRNEGEPGGGPFWTDEKNGTQTKQIVEQGHIDANSEEQAAKWKSSTHFNPVDLACGIRDFKSMKFDLKAFVDENAYLVSKKYQDGIQVKILEHPGLWNGSMAHWNTIFIELPIETFNPVKSVTDLLRPQHQPE